MKMCINGLTEWEARHILEALGTLEEKWLGIMETTSDEDEAADYGNDLATLRLTKDHFKEEAVKAFGSAVLNFSRLPA